MYFPHLLRQFLIVDAQFSQHVLRSDILGIVIGDVLVTDDIADRFPAVKIGRERPGERCWVLFVV